MEALGAAEHRGQSLGGDPDDVVLGLLSGERRAAGLSVEPEHLRPVVLGAEALGHDPRPHSPRRPVLRDLFEQVVVRVPEEAEPRCEVVDREPRRYRGLHVGDAVGKRERDLLDGGRSGFADVVPEIEIVFH